MTNRKRKLPCGRVIAASNPITPLRLQEWQKQLREYLAAQGLKYTAQRWTIAELILHTGSHLDAQTIVAKVKESAPAIGAATVYRSIKVLCDAGILTASHQDTNGRVLYELPHDEHHDHIICLDCGEIVEFHDDEIESLQIKVAKDNGFQLADHRHVIHGHCDLLKSTRRK
ncbi:MAG: transcriptional repressor [Bdellovibrionales bacterium]|nr:transcriptional repressor [Bdellovibrionales bacterium]